MAQVTSQCVLGFVSGVSVEDGVCYHHAARHPLHEKLITHTLNILSHQWILFM